MDCTSKQDLAWHQRKIYRKNYGRSVIRRSDTTREVISIDTGTLAVQKVRNSHRLCWAPSATHNLMGRGVTNDIQEWFWAWKPAAFEVTLTYRTVGWSTYICIITCVDLCRVDRNIPSRVHQPVATVVDILDIDLYRNQGCEANQKVDI